MTASPTGATTLLNAQQAALTHDQRTDTIALDPLRRRVPSLNIEEAITDARVVLTIEGASTLEITLDDPDWLVERSGILDVGDDGRVDAIRVTVDDLSFRLAAPSRPDAATLVLTFEDEAVALLRRHNRPMTASRGSMTRAQFIERMVREVKAKRIPFWSPERLRKQPTDLPDYPDVAPTQGETGFAKGTKLKVKGWDGSEHVLDADQMRNAATALGVADQLVAPAKATLALAEACIVEAPFFANPTGGDATSVGILQLLGDKLGGSSKTRGGRRDVALVCRIFLKDGFTGRGGAIALANAHPDWSAGQIAQAVQGSAFPDRYDAVHDSAKTVVDAFSSATVGGGANEQVLRTRSYQFSRGQDGKRETSWDAGTRLAEEVQWRLYAMGGVVWFVSDDYLISKPPSLILNGPFADGLIEPPPYDRDNNKPVNEVTLSAVADRWAVRQGEVVELQQMGPLTGRWIVKEVDQDLLNATETAVTLIKPVPPLKEPAADVIEVDTGTGPGGSDTPAGAQRAIKWARGELGHYKEDFGSNRGQELDALERGFGMVGAPWCAMFATTALVHGGVTEDCRTAAVADIRRWATAHSHGYLGFRATPKAGDLMCFGTEHVALVVNVSKDGKSVTTIEGNTSAGKVASLTRVTSSGAFVRPDYPT